MIAERAILPPFPNVSKSEDTPVVEELIRQGQVILLDRPELYLYTYHGMNTWDGYHWNGSSVAAVPLGAETSGLVTALLNSGTRGGTQLQARLASSIHKWELRRRRWPVRSQSSSGLAATSKALISNITASHLPAMPIPTEPVSSGSLEDARWPGCHRIGRQPGVH